MPYLTSEEILHAYPFGPPHRMAVYHNPNWWSLINNHNLGEPIKIKFNSQIRENMPPDIKGGCGIYMFFLETNHQLHDDVTTKQMLYVGRVKKGNSNFNFFKRFYKYVVAIGNKKVARNIMRLTNLWPDHTYVYYFNLTERSDEEITEIEQNIFNNIVPPLNERLDGDARLTRQFY
ncbi:hypothetical protein [Psychroflexus sediminis]|uniref:GIY-YIG domain-containing protein n=1 Tax=Psychroflexus sediminis TaxID=470826 RepID=A0A1G7V8H7_9FLAO|nr:hypothetical protein [Psychroflexus sediminis]SDG56073.1 hypothetical protein SAMN04488027_103152 [Psychroflexus sediminis]